MDGSDGDSLSQRRSWWCKYDFKAKCVDCHLPHDSYIGYVFKKASNGISEVTHMMTHDAKNQPWIENRKNRAKFVYDSGCLSCHKTILDKNSSNANITDMHALYSKVKDDVKINLTASAVIKMSVIIILAKLYMR